MDYMIGPAKVTFKDGEVLWAAFNGKKDKCLPNLYKTFEEMETNLKKYIFKKCSCGNVHEEVTIYTPFDDDFFGEWNGKACRNCMCITEGLKP